MNIRDAVNHPDFEILGLDAKNFHRFLELRAVELSTDEYRGAKINTPTEPLKIQDVKTFKDAKQMIGEILFQKRAV